ncbi:MAG: SDR family NAD(P)-dependent oxidoreductase [Bacteroidota bacterium]
MSRILVTGANGGIGLEIARELAQKGNEVLITSRDLAKGKDAQSKLGDEGLAVTLFKLDVGSEPSVEELAEQLATEYTYLDGLVNNAGVFQDQHTSLENVQMDVFRQTLETNFYGPLLLIRNLLPLLRKSGDARVVNLSSGLGALNEMGGGYPSYRISKTAMNAMTAIFGAELSKDAIQVNAVCPGWVQTDMGGAGATRTVEQGADTPVWLMTEERRLLPQGKFLRDRQVIDW